MFIEYLCNDWSQKLNLDIVICLKLIIFNVETSTFQYYVSDILWEEAILS